MVNSDGGDISVRWFGGTVCQVYASCGLIRLNQYLQRVRAEDIAEISVIYKGRSAFRGKRLWPRSVTSSLSS
jgi:hypothetical protein